MLTAMSRKDLHFVFLHCDLEIHRLAAQALRAVIFRQVYGNDFLFPSFKTDHALLQLRQKVSAAQLNHVVLPLKLLNGFRPNAPGIVDTRKVSLLSWTAFHRAKLRKFLSQTIQLLPDLRTLHHRFFPRNFKAPVFAQFSLRHDIHLRCEHKGFAPLWSLLKINFRLINRFDSGVLHPIHVPTPQVIVQHLTDHGFRTDMLKKHLGRHLPFAEARQIRVPRQALHRVIESSLYLFTGNLYLQLNGVALTSEEGGFHVAPFFRWVGKTLLETGQRWQIWCG